MLNLVQELSNVTVRKNCQREGVSPWRSRQKSSVLDWIATPAKPASNDCGRLACGAAFTMAEILLSLTIIGVVAAITLPSLTGNINERTWNTQRKALYARFSQAIALMPALNGYGTLKEETDSAGSTSIEDTAAETFITEGLAKVLKINNICDSVHLADCGLPDKITPYSGDIISSFPSALNELNPELASVTWNGSALSFLNTKAAAFETANGESIAVYYNPSCRPELNETYTHPVQNRFCVNFIFDLNGNKGPNTVGKDIGFITAFNPTDSTVVAPLPASTQTAYLVHEQASAFCQQQEGRLPNRDELAAMFFNKYLLGISSDSCWSSTIATFNPANAWIQNFNDGASWTTGKTLNRTIRCVKR